MAEAAQAEAGPQVAAAQGPVVVLAPGPVLARAQEARAVAQPAPRVQAAVVERLTKSETTERQTGVGEGGEFPGRIVWNENRKENVA